MKMDLLFLAIRSILRSEIYVCMTLTPSVQNHYSDMHLEFSLVSFCLVLFTKCSFIHNVVILICVSETNAIQKPYNPQQDLRSLKGP